MFFFKKRKQPAESGRIVSGESPEPQTSPPIGGGSAQGSTLPAHTQIVIVSKQDIVARNISVIDSGLTVAIERTRHARDFRTNIEILVDGFNEDTRSLWQIPEVVAWFKRLDPKTAYWLGEPTSLLFIKTWSQGLSDTQVERVFSWSEESSQMKPPYADRHRELAVIMLVDRAGNDFCHGLFPRDVATAENIVAEASRRLWAFTKPSHQEGIMRGMAETRRMLEDHQRKRKR
jgi:hypothetical protein